MMSSSGSSSSFHQQVSFGQNGRETKSYSMSQRTGPNGVSNQLCFYLCCIGLVSV